jgi:hypothetical protein
MITLITGITSAVTMVTVLAFAVTWARKPTGGTGE